MKLLDANVIIYASGAPHPYREFCRRVLSKVHSGEVTANINTEVLQEVLNYYHRIRETKRAVELFDDLKLAFPGALPMEIADAIEARTILERYPSLQTRDAFHAATVFQHNLEGIISADRGFDIIDGLKRFDPKELAA